LALAIVSYAGELSISGLGCSMTFGGAAVEEFLELYKQRLIARSRESAELVNA
jgi:hypothetical protein